MQFSGEVIYWRGPSPWHFVEVPDDESELLDANAPALSYGWGCIPVRAEIAGVAFRTSLFPRDGRYMLPVKAEVRRRARIGLGDVVDVAMLAGD